MVSEVLTYRATSYAELGKLTIADVIFERIIFRSDFFQEPGESILFHRGIGYLLRLGLLWLNASLHSVIVKHAVGEESVGHTTTVSIHPIVACFGVRMAQFQISARFGWVKSASVWFHFVFQSVFQFFEVVKNAILFLLLDHGGRSVSFEFAEFSVSTHCERVSLQGNGVVG